jgi:nitrate/nitrite transporter NarK
MTHRLLGVLLCIASLISLIGYIFMDRRSEDYYTRRNAASLGAFKLSSLKNFDKRYWVLCVICVTHYCAVVPLIAVGSDMLQVMYQYPQEKAGLTIGGIVLFATIFSPLCGKILDVVGRRPHASKATSIQFG